MKNVYLLKDLHTGGANFNQFADDSCLVWIVYIQSSNIFLSSSHFDNTPVKSFCQIRLKIMSKHAHPSAQTIKLFKVTGHSKVNFFLGFPPSVQDFFVI